MSAVELYLISGVAGYFLGSCPTGLLVGFSLGVDIRARGSGNIGATNALRVLGKAWGYLVFFLDALKGYLAVQSASWIATVSLPHLVETNSVVAGICAIAGHTFPVWLRFRGGKGVATSAGVLMALMPLAVVSVLIVWWGLFKATRYVSLASLVAAISLPILVAILLRFKLIVGEALFPFSLSIALIVICRHRSNIQRLIRGTEPRFRAKS